MSTHPQPEAAKAQLDRTAEAISQSNATGKNAFEDECAALEKRLTRHGKDFHALSQALQAFSVALPSWGVGTGGTRFARFPGLAEPRNVYDKCADCALIHQLTQAAPKISPHIPWDKVEDYSALASYATALGMGFDAINSNTFQDQSGQPHSYRYGSLSHTHAEVREQAIAHNLECIEIGKKLGSKALTVWIADGSNFAGQVDFREAFARYLSSMEVIVKNLPSDWIALVEYKFFEPAFYSTVIADWGTSYLAATHLGDQVKCLVDLGHHAKSANVEMIVSRLAQFGKLGGFHFNDSQYGDDDLDTSSLHPFQLFLIFYELVKLMEAGDSSLAYMIDQSHNVTDPIESLIVSVEEIMIAYAKALLVRGNLLREHQAGNDAMMAHREMKEAFSFDVRPLVMHARAATGGALDPLGVYRGLGYREEKSSERPVIASIGGGIV